MKRNKIFHIAVIFAALITLLTIASSAFALSDKEYKQMMKNSEFAQADKALNQAWKNAKSSLSEDDFETLKKDQMNWIKKGRDNEAKVLMKKMNKTKAYATVTMERAEYINQYVNGIDEPETTEADEVGDVPSETEENDVPDTPSDDLPDDLPEDTPSDTPKKSSEPAPKKTNLSSQEDAATLLEERLVELEKIDFNETLEFVGEVEQDGEKCWEFSATYNFNETGRYAISQSGKIYEYDNEQYNLVK